MVAYTMYVHIQNILMFYLIGQYLIKHWLTLIRENEMHFKNVFYRSIVNGSLPEIKEAMFALMPSLQLL